MRGCEGLKGKISEKGRKERMAKQKNPKIEFLMGYLEALRRIEAKNAQIEILYGTMMPRAQSFDGMPSGGKGVDMCEKFGDLFELIENVNSEIEALKQKRKSVLGAINAVQDAGMRTVLECRYVSGMGWERIAKIMNYDKSTAWRIHGRALNYIVLPENKQTDDEIQKIARC